MNIIFFGSGHYSPIVLRSIIGEPTFKVNLVVTGDLNKKSPAQLTASLTRDNQLPLFSWTSEAQDFELINKIKSQMPDFIVVADFGHRKKLIPAELLALPRFGAVNIHPSLLPKYRGTTPVQTAIINGDKETGVSLILMDEKFDHGPLIAQATFPLEPTAEAPELYEKLFELGARMLPSALEKVVAKIPPLIQDETKATYTKMLKKEMGRIDWTRAPLEIERMVRAYANWPGSWTTIEELRSSKLKVQSAKFKVDSRSVKILKAHIGDKGELIIDKLQIEGKKPISWEEFGRGYLR